MYSFHDRVKFSEITPDQNMTYFALVNYMQNCSCFHSDEVGYGLDYLVPKDLGWFVTSYEIHVVRMPRYSEKIVISTFPYNFRGMMARRKYTIETEDGAILAYGDSQWILMNLKEARPERAPQDMIDAYMSDQRPCPDLSFEGDRLKPAGPGDLVGQFQVNESCIDTNGHMNNAFYIDITKKFLPEASFSSIKINYKKAALFNDKLGVYLVKLNDGYQVILKKDDDIYTIVEYK